MRTFCALIMVFLCYFPGYGKDQAEERGSSQKYQRAMIEMRTIGNKISSYILDNSNAPKAINFKELVNSKEYIPFGFNKFPQKDPWGNSYYYKTDGKNYWLGCAGNDGVFKGYNQKGRYKGLGEDIIFSNGRFIYIAIFE